MESERHTGHIYKDEVEMNNREKRNGTKTFGVKDRNKGSGDRRD